VVQAACCPLPPKNVRTVRVDHSATRPVPVVDNVYPYPNGPYPDQRRRFLPQITLGRATDPTIPHLAKAIDLLYLLYRYLVGLTGNHNAVSYG